MPGMPSGRRFPVLPLFGMYTRLTGWACQGSVLCCTQSTNSTLASGSNTTFPSTPAVLRPALRSVTRRTLRSVFARDRSINFCKLRTLLRSPALLAVKIRSRRRRTSSSVVPQSIASQSRWSSSGPFTTPTTTDVAVCLVVMASNLPFGSGAIVSVSAQAHLTRVSTLSGRASPYPASCPGPSTEEPSRVSRFPAAFRPSAFASRVILCPPGNWSSSRSTDRTCWRPDPDGVTTFRAHELRPGRVPPVSRGRRCSTRSASNPRPAPAASQRPAPKPHLDQPIGGDAFNETSTEVHAIHPSGLALTCGPRMEREPLGLNPELRTPPLPATHVRAGTDHRAPARNYATDISRPSCLRVRSQRATSCRNLWYCLIRVVLYSTCRLGVTPSVITR